MHNKLFKKQKQLKIALNKSLGFPPAFSLSCKQMTLRQTKSFRGLSQPLVYVKHVNMNSLNNSGKCTQTR